METPPHAPRTVSDIAGARVRTARERRGWTLQQLADAVSELGGRISRHAIHDIERGRPGADAARQRQITLDEWLLLAEALAVPPLWLIVPLDGTDQLATTPATERGPASAIPWLLAERPGHDLSEDAARSWRTARGALSQMTLYVRQLATIAELLDRGPDYREDAQEAARQARQTAAGLEALGIAPPAAPAAVSTAIAHG